jgi:hypothetical protein
MNSRRATSSSSAAAKAIWTNWPDGSFRRNPASVLVIGDACESANLVRALRAAGSESRIFGGPAMGRRLFFERAGRDAEGAVFPQLFVPDSEQEHDFDYAAAHTYDAVQLLVAAIRSAGLNRAAIGDALRELSPTTGITGQIRWDGLGSNTRPVRLARLHAGEDRQRNNCRIFLPITLPPPTEGEGTLDSCFFVDPKPVPPDARPDVPETVVQTSPTVPMVADRLVSATPRTVALALDGRALQPVVVSAEASEATRRAAADLAETLGRISGAAFPVIEGDGRSGLAVGVAGDFPDLPVEWAFGSEPLDRESYLLRSHADGIWILGASGRAVEHAVWDLLHRLGYRLFFLTDTWEVVPEQTDLRLAVDGIESPITSRAKRLAVRRGPTGRCGTAGGPATGSPRISP